MPFKYIQDHSDSFTGVYLFMRKELHKWFHFFIQQSSCSTSFSYENHVTLTIFFLIFQLTPSDSWVLCALLYSLRCKSWLFGSLGKPIWRFKPIFIYELCDCYLKDTFASFISIVPSSSPSSIDESLLTSETWR
jgi:hypothetical protein